MNARIAALVLPLLTAPLFSQNVALPSTAAACGPAAVKLNVKTADGANAPAPVEDPGKATVIMIEDQVQERPGHAPCPKCSTRVQLGMDGEWIAAASGLSHTSVSVAPGEHHFCAAGSDHVLTASPLPSFMPLHLGAGKTYYLRAKLTLLYSYNVVVLDLSEINEDEGRYLVSVTKRATFSK